MIISWGQPQAITEQLDPEGVHGLEPRVIPLPGDRAVVFYLTDGAMNSSDPWQSVTPDDTLRLYARFVGSKGGGVGSLQMVWTSGIPATADYRHMWDLQPMGDGTYLAFFVPEPSPVTSTIPCDFQFLHLSVDDATGTISIIEELEWNTYPAYGSTRVNNRERSRMHSAGPGRAVFCTHDTGGANDYVIWLIDTAPLTVHSKAVVPTPGAGTPSGLWVDEAGTKGVVTFHSNHAVAFTISGNTITYGASRTGNNPDPPGFAETQHLVSDGTHVLFGDDWTPPGLGSSIVLHKIDPDTLATVSWAALTSDPDDLWDGGISAYSANRMGPRIVLPDGKVCAVWGGWIPEVELWTLMFVYDAFGDEPQRIPLPQENWPYDDFYWFAGLSIALCATENGVMVAVTDQPDETLHNATRWFPTNVWWVDIAQSVITGGPVSDRRAFWRKG
jgi:hypothetical protein